MLTPPSLLELCFRVRSVRRSVLFAWQRVTRGWDDSAVWSLDVHTAKMLGEQLARLAKTTHGYPADGYTAESWVAELEQASADLLAHVPGVFVDQESYERGVRAMRWVADHFADLWD